MELQVVNNQRIITPSENKWLYNANAKVVSDKVYLGVNADEKEWVEITTEEKEVLESKWNVEPETEATEQDYQNALMEMGVKFDE